MHGEEETFLRLTLVPYRFSTEPNSDGCLQFKFVLKPTSEAGRRVDVVALLSDTDSDAGDSVAKGILGSPFVGFRLFCGIHWQCN